MTVDKQWEQTVTPTSIDPAPSPPSPTLTNNTTLIPPTLNLYESPTAPPPFSTTTDKNDKWPTPSSLCHHLPVPRVGCPRHYKPISPRRNPIEWAPFFSTILLLIYFILFFCGRKEEGYSSLQVPAIISTHRHVTGVISAPQGIRMHDVKPSKKTSERNYYAFQPHTP